MTIYTINLLDQYRQKLRINLNDNNIDVVINYNSFGKFYVADFYINDVAVLNGVGLLSGINLFKQFGITELKNLYILNKNELLKDVNDNIGSTAYLFYQVS